MDVWFGKRNMVGSAVTHWGLRVGKYWYEVNPEKEDVIKAGLQKIPMEIKTTEARADGSSGYGTVTIKRLGSTRKSAQDIETYNRDFKANHNTYWLFSENCQRYVVGLVGELLGQPGLDQLPPEEADQARPWIQGIVRVLTGPFSTESMVTNWLTSDSGR